MTRDHSKPDVEPLYPIGSGSFLIWRAQQEFKQKKYEESRKRWNSEIGWGNEKSN